MRGSELAGLGSRTVTLVFDGDCGFCTACAALLRRLDRVHRLRLVPAQEPGICQALGLTSEDCASAAWASGAEGGVVRGAEAILVGLSAAIGWAWIAGLYRRPAMRRAADAIYEWVARHRGLLPGMRPYCRARPDECGRSGRASSEEARRAAS